MNNKKRFHTKSALNWYLEAGYFYGTLTESRARVLAGVNRTTFDRWLRGESAAPAATLELLRLHAFGEPPGGFGSTCWQGFRFANGRIISDYGIEFTPGDLRQAGRWKRLAMEYINVMECRKLKKEATQ